MPYLCADQPPECVKKITAARRIAADPAAFGRYAGAGGELARHFETLAISFIVI